MMKNIDFSKYPLPGRIRHHSSSNLYMPLADLNGLPEYYPPVYTDGDIAQLFANSAAPSMLDIGCGKGAFLLEMAFANPESNILGIELRLSPVNWLKKIIAGEEIGNCAVIWYSIANGLGFIHPESIEKIFYLFPDPWPKRKHIKRRVLNRNLVPELRRVIKPGGKLFISTDLKDIHEYHKKIINASGCFSFSEISGDCQWKLPITNKERFCLNNGIETYRLLCSPLTYQ